MEALNIEVKENSPEKLAIIGDGPTLRYIMAEEFNLMVQRLEALRQVANNIDVFKYVKVSDLSIQTFIIRINQLPAYTIDEKTSLWFAAIYLDDNGNIHKSIYKVKILGAGTYGLDQTVITADRVEYISTNPATSSDIENLANTQTIDLGEIGATIVSLALDASANVMIDNSPERFVLIKTLVSGIPTDYKFIGVSGTYGIGGTESIESDFELIPAGLGNTNPLLTEIIATEGGEAILTDQAIIFTAGDFGSPTDYYSFLTNIGAVGVNLDYYDPNVTMSATITPGGIYVGVIENDADNPTTNPASLSVGGNNNYRTSFFLGHVDVRTGVDGGVGANLKRFNWPDKPDGEYTLATLNDISEGGGVTEEEVETAIEDANKYTDDALDTIREVIEFGVGNDGHKNDVSNSGNRYRLEANIKTQAVVDFWNLKRTHFNFYNGDLMDNSTALASIKAVLDTANAPMYYSDGNHDRDMYTKESFAAAIGKPVGNYDFTKKGVHFIVLDCNYNSFNDNDPYANGNYDSAVAYMNPTQLNVWLPETLEKNNLPKFIFCHHPISHEGVEGVVNAPAIRSVLENCNRRILGIAQAHEHESIVLKINGLTYYTIGAICVDPFPTNAAAVFRIELDGTVRVTGFGTQPSINLVSPNAGGLTVLGKNLPTISHTGITANTSVKTFNISGGLCPTEAVLEFGTFVERLLSGTPDFSTVSGYVNGTEIFRYYSAKTGVGGYMRKRITVSGGKLYFPFPGKFAGLNNETPLTGATSVMSEIPLDVTLDWPLQIYIKNDLSTDTTSLKNMIITAIG